MITDTDGHQYFYYHSAFGSILLGHNLEPVNRRVAGMIQKIALLSTETTDLEIELSRRTSQHAPSAEMVLFCNRGY